MLGCWALESVLSCHIPYRAHLQLVSVAPAIVLTSSSEMQLKLWITLPQEIIPYRLPQAPQQRGFTHWTFTHWTYLTVDLLEFFTFMDNLCSDFRLSTPAAVLCSSQDL